MFRARRGAEQGNPGNRLPKGRNEPEGGDVMGKTVQYTTGSLLATALVVSGWVAFGIGFFISEPLLRLALLAIARVLP